MTRDARTGGPFSSKLFKFRPSYFQKPPIQGESPIMLRHNSDKFRVVFPLQAGVVMAFFAALLAPETVSKPLLTRRIENGF